MKRLFAPLAGLAAALALCLVAAPAFAGELKCEPDKLATRHLHDGGDRRAGREG
jgi:hypothetical protein